MVAECKRLSLWPPTPSALESGELLPLLALQFYQEESARRCRLHAVWLKETLKAHDPTLPSFAPAPADSFILGRLWPRRGCPPATWDGLRCKAGAGYIREAGESLGPPLRAQGTHPAMMFPCYAWRFVQSILRVTGV